MRHFFIALFVFLLVTACKPPAESEPVQSAETNDEVAMPVNNNNSQPMADKRPHEITIHGHTRMDEYHWLRDDDRSDPDVLAYLEAENQYFDEQMSHTAELQESLYEEMTGRLDPDDSSVPYEQGGYWYYSRYEPEKEYAVHARRKGNMEAEEEILLDGNLRAEGHEFYRLRGAEMSDDQRYMAFAEDTMGRRINTIRILDTQSGELLDYSIGNASNSLAFSAGGRYLFYLDKHPETLLAYRLMRHELGTDPAADVLVYEEQDNTFYNGVWRSRSGDYIFLGHQNTDTTELQLLRADNPDGKFKPFLPRSPGHEYSVDHAGDDFFVRTNLDAVNFRVMKTTMENSADPEQWQEVIPHRDNAMVRDLQAFDDWLVVEERKDGLRKVRVLSHDGKVDRYLDADEKTYVMWIGENVSTHTNHVRYGFSSPVTPGQTWEINLATGENTLLKADHIRGDFDSSNYRTGRLMVTARDGVEVPVSLAYHKDTPLDGTAPALVYSYGSYGSSTDPWFRNSVISLLDRNFIYVIAHIRGGQEMGRQWYEDGKMFNKKNTFNDFVDVTKSLQADGVIDPERTFAMGGSAGGLLMGAVINQAPELYRGVVAAVPFVDVVTTMLDESIPLTTGEFKEWGNPKEKDSYDYMLSYSPYDQVSAQDYPNLMVTTGLHDSQVQYFEPAKWVARLRDRRTDNNRLVMHTNMDAGHGGASGRYEQYREVARDWAFMVDLAGLEH